MISDETLKLLLGLDAEPRSLLISAPTSGWRTAPAALVKREVNRLRARSQRAAERITWAAPSGRRSRFPALRQSVLSGYIWLTLPTDSAVAMVRTETPFTPTDELRIGSGGGIRQRGTWDGEPVIARFGLEHSPGDPSWHFQALQQFRFGQVPKPIERGEVDGVLWTIESFISGRPPRQLTESVISQTSSFLARLPIAPEGSDVVATATAELAQYSVDLGDIAARMDATFRALPSAVNHGDFWSGNLLFDDSRLVGVIDWDSWRPKGVCGIDLVHLYAEDRRRSQGLSYGDLVEQSFWSDKSVTRTLARHFDQKGLSWEPTLTSELAAAWWMTAAAGALRRTPRLAENPVWMDRNVHRPARRFA